MNDFIKKTFLSLGVLVTGAGLYIFNAQPSAEIIVKPATVSHETLPITIPQVTIHIAGAVYQPGVYDVNVGTRALEALKLAGGTTPDANLDKVNLAKIIKDGQRIYVPFDTKQKTSLPASSTNKILINSASSASLQRIPGIGPALANEIISYRSQHGPFQAWNDLLAVKYIGKKMLAKLKVYGSLTP